MAYMKDWHILVVEDEPDGQEVVSGILGLLSISTDVVASAEEALQLLEENRYNAVIIDIALPGMNGMDLIEKIRANDTLSSLPCIAITAYHSSVVKQQALAAGFNSYFSKPIDDTSFMREVDRIVKSK